MSILTFITELQLLLNDSAIILDDNKKEPFEIDWRKKFRGSSIAVVFPQSVTEIQNIITLCAKHNVKITAQGGNTSTCGAAVPINDNSNHIIISLSKLNKIIELDEKNSSITVESGCTLLQIKEFVKQYNLYFPLKIAAEGSCQIGGNIATNAGGINVIQYGTMRDLTLGIEAVLPNGQIVNQLKKLRKDNTNFDLKQLFIGSEGTLGIITKATLKLYPSPFDHVTFMVGLDTIEECINLLTNIKAHKITPCAFEIMNKQTQAVYNVHFNDNKIPIEHNWLVCCEIEVNSKEHIEYIHDVLIRVINHNESFILANSIHERDKIWSIREHIPIAEKLFGDAIKYDISLPISHIPSFIQTNSNNLLKYNLKNDTIIFGHLGDGNLHYNIPLNGKTLSIEEIDQIHEVVYTDVVNLGGSISAEHGIGQLKTGWFEKFYDQNSYNLAHNIKTIVDPLNLFNPGKVFRK